MVNWILQKLIGTYHERERKRLWPVVMVGGLVVIAGAMAQASKQPFGTPQRGLKASLHSERSIYQVTDAVTVSVELTNVSQEPIAIDAWEGNWLVRVFDEAFHELTPSVRAADILRPAVTASVLQPGQTWQTPIAGLRLVTGLPGSTPLWAYDVLAPGRYWLGANYIAHPDPRHPEIWSGGVTSELVQIEINRSY